MTMQKRRLILRLVRFQNWSDALDAGLLESYDRDRLFDGGEFSGPALVRLGERHRRAAAQLLGFESVDVIETVIDSLGARLRVSAFVAGDAIPLPN